MLAVFAGSLLPVTFSTGFSRVAFVGSTFGETLGSAIASTFTRSAFTGVASSALTLADSTFAVSLLTDRTSTGLASGSFCLIASGSLMSVVTSEITSALTVGAISNNITCGKAKIASLKRGAEVFFIILLHPVGSYY